MGTVFSRIDDRWVRWLLAPAIVFISQTTNDAYLVDFWHHLVRGREMVRTGQLLDRDIFTFTVPDRPFLDVNWLTQIAYFQLFSWGGLELVRTVNALLLAGSWAWLAGICKRIGGSLEIAMAIGLATFLGAWQVLTIRPQTMSILLFIGLYDVLLRSEKDWRWLCFAPLFLALWANVHGAFPAGLMLIGMFAAGRVGALFFSPLPRYSGGEGPGVRGTKLGGTSSTEECLPLSPQPGSPGLPGGEGARTRIGTLISALPTIAIWGVAAIACAAATLVNPYGWEIYEYARHTSGISARRGIDEWLPPSWDQGIGAAWFLSLPIVFGVLAWSWKKGRRVARREAFLLACFGSLAATSIRMVLWWLIVIAPMICIRLADFWPRSRAATYAPSRAATITVGGLLVACALSLPPLHGLNPLLVLRSPNETTANLEEALKFIESRQDKGRLFAKLEWGEYLGWRGSPNWKVFMDGRIEIYPDDVWEDYATFTMGNQPGFRRLVTPARYGAIHYFIFDLPFHLGKGTLPKRGQELDNLSGVKLGTKDDAKDKDAAAIGWNLLFRRGDVLVYSFFWPELHVP